MKFYRDEAPKFKSAFSSRDKKKKTAAFADLTLSTEGIYVHSLHSSLSSTGNPKQAVSPDVFYDVGARESWSKESKASVF